jgi:hypothetical protein
MIDSLTSEPEVALQHFEFQNWGSVTNLMILIIVMAMNRKVVVNENKLVAGVKSSAFSMHSQMSPLWQLFCKQGQRTSKLNVEWKHDLSY